MKIGEIHTEFWGNHPESFKITADGPTKASWFPQVTTWPMPEFRARVTQILFEIFAKIDDYTPGHGRPWS